jgi:hypothetical protein
MKQMDLHGAEPTGLVYSLLVLDKLGRGGNGTAWRVRRVESSKREGDNHRGRVLTLSVGLWEGSRGVRITHCPYLVSRVVLLLLLLLVVVALMMVVLVAAAATVAVLMGVVLAAKQIQQQQQ